MLTLKLITEETDRVIRGLEKKHFKGAKEAVDEVLAVGDGAFRAKSEAKMREIIKSGVTTILVSHSISQIRALCNKVLWLHKGVQIAFTGDVQGVCDSYEAFLRAPTGTAPKFDPAEIAAKRAAAGGV